MEQGRLRRVKPRRIQGTVEEEQDLDKRLQELQMYEPGMTLDHKRQIIAVVEESMGTSLAAEPPSSPSLSSRPKKSINYEPAVVMISSGLSKEGVEETETQRTKEQPDGKVEDNVGSRLQEQQQESDAHSVEEPQQQSDTHSVSVPSDVELIPIESESESDIELENSPKLIGNDEADKKEKQTSFTKMTRKSFIALEQRASLIAPFQSKIESISPVALPPCTFSHAKFQNLLSELKNQSEVRLRSLLDFDQREVTSNTILVSQRFGQTDFTGASQSQEQFEATPETSSCPICGKIFPVEEIENHASDCTDYGGLEFPAAEITGNGKTRPSRTQEQQSYAPANETVMPDSVRW